MRLKNLLILSIAVLSGLVMGMGAIEYHSHLFHPLFYRYLGDKNIFTELVKEENLDSPLALSVWMFKNLEYKLDEEVYSTSDYWQTPLETLKLKTGDCEDLAFFAQEILNQMGIKSNVVIMKNHVICVFDWQEGYYIFDNQELYQAYTYKNIDDIVNKGYKNIGYYILNYHILK